MFSYPSKTMNKLRYENKMIGTDMMRVNSDGDICNIRDSSQLMFI